MEINSEENIYNIVAEIFAIGDRETITDLSRDHSESWDSFQHLLLISELEKRLEIKFSIEEVGNIKNFKTLKQIIQSKTNL